MLTATKRRIPSRAAITRFIRRWIKDTMAPCGDHPGYATFDELLNQGYCADLATVIWEHFGGPDSFVFHSCEDPCHVWIEFEGLHFDMQNPEGVANWRDMEYFKDSPEAVLDS